VALDGRLVRIGKAAVGREAHHAEGVEEQYRGTLDAEARSEGFERRTIDLLDRAAAADGASELEKYGGRHREPFRKGVRLHIAQRPSLGR
jgi:hypothetical protein